MYAVETTKLTKFYTRGKVEALNSCTLQVEKGMIFSLLGPNGAGKTTLIKLLLGIIHPTRGEAKILGKPISDHRIHAKIGYLAENHRFPEFLTAAQVLFYFGKMTGLDNNCIKEKIPQLLQTVKLADWANTKISKFSKGMMQRLGLAQAMLHDPELLILDEPTDGIDPVGRREIRDMLKTLRDQGKTIFLNSHLLSEVERISDEIAILNGGRLIKKGRIQDFLSVHEQYQLRIDNGQALLEQSCKKLDIPLHTQDALYTVSVKDAAHLNQLIDILRGENVTIKAITPRKISLEDFFIDVLGAGEGAGR